MNFKLIVAAVALAAAGTASAAVQSFTATTDGGEMSMTVYSKQAGLSFLFDTGIRLVDFRANPFAVTSWSMEGNTAFDTFLSIYNAAGASDMRWTFFGGDNSGGQAPLRSMIATVSGDVSVINSLNLTGSMDYANANYLVAANKSSQLAGPDNLNASGVFQKGIDGDAYFLEAVGPDFGGRFQDTSNVVGSSTALYDLVRASTNNLAKLNVEQIGFAKFGVNGGAYTLTVTPVPEPSTYALMIAGLAVAGIAARRRAAK